MTADRAPSSVRSVAFLRRRSEGSPIGAKSTQIKITKSRPNVNTGQNASKHHKSNQSASLPAKTSQTIPNRAKKIQIAVKPRHKAPNWANPQRAKIELQRSKTNRNGTQTYQHDQNSPKCNRNGAKLRQTRSKLTTIGENAPIRAEHPKTQS